MTSPTDCTLAERLAGAIAAGEAGDGERDAYRFHLASCARCVDELGGEREIERVMSAIAMARDSESWEPDLRSAVAGRRAPRRSWALAGVLVAAAVAVVAFRTTQAPPAVAPPHAVISAQEARALAALDTQTAAHREGRAESLTVGSATTLSTMFQISVDDRGRPVRCTIAQSSGNPVLDRSVCAAAMRAHYSLQH
jgi:hypothetical protein